MFKQIDLVINGKNVTSAPQTYPYKAYLVTLLGYDESAKRSHLASSFWMDKKNFLKNLKKAKGDTLTVELMGCLHLDLIPASSFNWRINYEVSFHSTQTIILLYLASIF